MPLGPRHLIGNFGTLIVTLVPATATVAAAPFVAPAYTLPLYVPGATAATAAAVRVAAPTRATAAAES